MTPAFLITYLVAGIHTMLLVVMFAGRRSPPPVPLVLLLLVLWPALVPAVVMVACIDWLASRKRR